MTGKNLNIRRDSNRNTPMSYGRLVENIATEGDFSSKDVEDFLKALQVVAKNAIKNNEKIEIPNFIRIYSIIREETTANHPLTLKEVLIPKHRTVKVLMSRAFQSEVREIVDKK